jgi:tRNA (guanosine-2'-O-)-methyltransferase
VKLRNLKMGKRGYCGIGIYNTKCPANIGTLWRTAHSLEVDFIFTIGSRYKHDKLDTSKAPKHLPLFQFDSFHNFKLSIPIASLVAVELNNKSRPLKNFIHPERAIYLLGAEDTGIPDNILNDCDSIVQLPGNYCLNVAVAGSIVLYDRNSKR